MYHKLNIVDDLIAGGRDFSLKHDRARYDELMKTAEQYCAANKLIIGGSNCTATMSKAPVTLSSYKMELYADDALAHARKLADELYRICIETNKKQSTLTIPPETISVESKIRNKLFVIWINGRSMIDVHTLGKYRNVELRELINPVVYKSQFANVDILCLSHEIQLISVYQDLYKPYSTKDHASYTDLIAEEQLLYAHMIERKSGGSEVKRAIDPKNIQRMITALFAELHSDTVVIGDYACDVQKSTNGNKSPNNQRLQLLSGDIKALTKIIENIAADILGNKFKVVVAKFDLKIPSDSYLTKYTIYVENHDLRHSFADVFDSLTYETVPFVKRVIMGSSVQCATEFVLLRFKFIDIYALRLIIQLGGNSDFLERRIDELYAQINAIRTKVYEDLNKNPFDVFQLNSYAGIYIEETILARKQADPSKRIFIRYYPHNSSEIAD